ncbi:MAG: type II secretion system protein M, partial [Paraglaciecola sp.]|nr:type II secretion system protein M [Paraglaciecola sp.]
MNKSLNAYYLMLCQKFNAISLREQFMVLLFGVALIAFITYMLLIDPLMVSNARLDEDIKRNQQQLDTVMSQIDDLSAAIR